MYNGFLIRYTWAILFATLRQDGDNDKPPFGFRYPSHMKQYYTRTTTISFKCSPTMLNSMNEIMIKRYIDRSSVIRLALYLLDSYMRDPAIADCDLFELLDRMESIHPNREVSFSQFCGFTN